MRGVGARVPRALAHSLARSRHAQPATPPPPELLPERSLFLRAHIRRRSHALPPHALPAHSKGQPRLQQRRVCACGACGWAGAPAKVTARAGQARRGGPLVGWNACHRPATSNSRKHAAAQPCTHPGCTERATHLAAHSHRHRPRHSRWCWAPPHPGRPRAAACPTQHTRAPLPRCPPRPPPPLPRPLPRSTRPPPALLPRLPPRPPPPLLARCPPQRTARLRLLLLLQRQLRLCLCLLLLRQLRLRTAGPAVGVPQRAAPSWPRPWPQARRCRWCARRGPVRACAGMRSGLRAQLWPASAHVSVQARTATRTHAHTHALDIRTYIKRAQMLPAHCQALHVLNALRAIIRLGGRAGC